VELARGNYELVPELMAEGAVRLADAIRTVASLTHFTYLLKEWCGIFIVVSFVISSLEI